jgi:hypothetical protein
MVGYQLHHLSQFLARIAARSHQAHLHALDETLVEVERLAYINISHHHHHATWPCAFDGWLDVFYVRPEYHHRICPPATCELTHLLDVIIISALSNSWE